MRKKEGRATWRAVCCAAFLTVHVSPPPQLINSVYMDNSNLELYHGRLDKKPGAIALRIR